VIRLQTWGPPLVIMAAVALVFANSLGNGFHYDDEHSLLQNPHIRTMDLWRFLLDPAAFSAFAEARMYRPVVLAAHALNYQLGGYQPWGYHLFNMLVHGLNAVLVWRLGRRIGLAAVAALFAALLFAVHPLATEPVNYISSRSSLLVAAGVLLALGGGLGIGPGRGWVWLMGGALLGLGSKAVAVVLPLLVFAALLRQGLALKYWARWASLLVLALGYVVWTQEIIGRALGTPVRGLSQQAATQLKALGYYLWTALVPVKLSVEPQFGVSAWDEWAVFLALVFVLSLVLLLVLLIKWSRQSDGATVVAYGVFWAGVALVPVLVVPLHVLVNEHRLYLPLVGLCWALAAVWPKDAKRSGIALLALLALLSFQRNRVWHDEESLWGDAASKGPLMARPQINLGKAYLEQGRWDEAIAASRRGLRLDPSLALAHYNIGTAYLAQENWDAAEASYSLAVELKPDLGQAHNNLGNVFRQRGRYDLAVSSYRRAIELGGDRGPLWHNLATAWLEAGRIDSAISAYERAVVLSAPPSVEMYRGLIKAYLSDERLQAARQAVVRAQEQWPQELGLLLLLGDIEAAAGQMSTALSWYRRGGLAAGQDQWRLAQRAMLRFDWPAVERYCRQALDDGWATEAVYVGLGRSLENQGAIGQALDIWRRAARSGQASALPYAYIGRAFLRQNKTLEATAALERAVELDAADDGWQALLGQAYERSGRLEEAVLAYTRALERAPYQGQYWLNIAVLHQRLGAIAAAGAALDRAVKLLPEKAAAHYAQGAFLLEGGRCRPALRALEQAVALEPGHATAWLGLAEARLCVKQTDAANAFRRFLELYGKEDELTRRARRQLQILEGP
jgi:protein O-mannosyl-transferase